MDGAYLSSVSQNLGIPDVCDSLDIWCPDRVANTEKALGEVEELLNRLDDCEQLFPSSRVLVANNEAWTDEEYQNRVKVLCVWYNLTVQLHQKTEQLGKALVGLGAKLGKVPWPALKTPKEAAPCPQETPAPDQSNDKTNEASEANTDVPDCKKSPVKIVKFQVSEDVASTTSPSDSNNSTDSSDRNKLLSTRR